MEQHLELEALGVLRQTKVPPELAWMTDEEKAFVLDVFLAGNDGMHKRDALKFDKKHPAAFIELQVRDLIRWESDKAGKPMFIVLSWKGDEVARLLFQIAKNTSKKQTTPQGVQ